MAGTSKPRKTEIEVSHLRGGEVTPFGEVAYITCEPDGVDVTFVAEHAGDEAPCFHFAYGETLEVRP